MLDKSGLRKAKEEAAAIQTLVCSISKHPGGFPTTSWLRQDALSNNIGKQRKKTDQRDIIEATEEA